MLQLTSMLRMTRLNRTMVVTFDELLSKHEQPDFIEPDLTQPILGFQLQGPPRDHKQEVAGRP